jgi:N-acetylmuramoyl-L-alanine amidase
MANKVFIGVGHGGSDPGACKNGFEEADLNLAIAKATADELERHGVKVKMSRKKDENDPLTDEIKECNAYAPDLALDIHSNAGGGDGCEVYYSIYGGTGKVLANNILKEVEKIGQNSRGAKTKKNATGSDYYGFIRQTKAPAVIVECAFVDNKKDIKIIDTKAEQIAFGKAIAKGVLKTLGVAYKPEAPAVKEEKVYRVFDKDGKQAGAYSKEANAFDKAKELLKAGGSVKITFGKK